MFAFFFFFKFEVIYGSSISETASPPTAVNPLVSDGLLPLHQHNQCRALSCTMPLIVSTLNPDSPPYKFGI